MVNDESAIIKRIIKSYLYFKGEATSRMLVNHIDSVGYGLKCIPSPNKLTYDMKKWSRTHRSGAWFNVVCDERNGELYWSLRK